MSSSFTESSNTKEKRANLSSDNRAILQYSPEAFAKMYSLITDFDTEVAWHGLCYRDTVQSNRFIIYDILVYPQEVTGGTVIPSQKDYEDWLYDRLTDDEFSNLRVHGHSHVNFSPSPSSIDKGYQKGKLKDVTNDMFFIFMIYNKHMEKWIRIYDKKNDAMYYTRDIDVVISSCDCDIEDFLKRARSVAKRHYNSERSVHSNDGSFENI